MKQKDINSEPAFIISNNKSLEIQTYGEFNDYPQSVNELICSSSTASSCVKIFNKFVKGSGFESEEFENIIVNRKGETMGQMLNYICSDYCRYFGFSLHFNYNLNLDIREINYVPFEHVRFSMTDDKTGFFDSVKLCPDWTGEYKHIYKADKTKIEPIKLFTKNTEDVESQILLSGGLENYKGQLFYYSGDGLKTYPTSLYDSILTDMRADEGLSDLLGNSVCRGIFTPGMIVDYSPNKSDEELKELEGEILNLQTAKNANKILYHNTQGGIQKPEFIPFASENYSKDFENTSKIIPQIIGRVFLQPPILRAEDVGSNFGSKAVKEAYDFYNSITFDDRKNISDALKVIFERYYIKYNFNTNIKPLSYGSNLTIFERLGENAVKDIIDFMKDDTVEELKRINIISKMYGISEEEIKEII